MEWKDLPFIFTTTPAMAGYAMAYKLPGLVADEIMPRIDNVDGRDSFKLLLRNPGDAFQIINDRVGRRSIPSEVEFTGKETTDSCDIHSLTGFVSKTDIINSDQSKYESLVNRESNSVLELINLQREIRVIEMVQNPDNYANVRILELGEKLTDPDAKPIEMISELMLECLMTPNQLRFGSKIWNMLRRHPNTIKEVYGVASTKGAASREDLASHLEIEKIIVGMTRANAAKKGQKANIISAWGDTISGAYVNAQATKTEGTVTWGFTAQNGPRLVSLILAEKTGGRGGMDVMVTEALKEVVAAKDCGFLMTGVI